MMQDTETEQGPRRRIGDFPGEVAGPLDRLIIDRRYDVAHGDPGFCRRAYRLEPHPVIVVPSMLAPCAVCQTGNADGRTAIRNGAAEGPPRRGLKDRIRHPDRADLGAILTQSGAIAGGLRILIG